MTQTQPISPSEASAPRPRLLLVYPLAAANVLLGVTLLLIPLHLLMKREIDWTALLPLLMVAATGASMIAAAAGQLFYRLCPWRLAFILQLFAAAGLLLLAVGAAVVALHARTQPPHVPGFFISIAKWLALLGAIWLTGVAYLNRRRVRKAFWSWSALQP